jgi:gliding motility-associated-like protein
MFRIMNRWGQIIFESANSSVMGWDGTFNGVPQDVGVYYYYLRYDCGGKSMEAKGDVTLIR